MAGEQNMNQDLDLQFQQALDAGDMVRDRMAAERRNTVANVAVDGDALDPTLAEAVQKQRAESGVPHDLDDPSWLAQVLEVPAQFVTGMFVDTANSLKDLLFDAGTAGAKALYVDALGVANEAELKDAADRTRAMVPDIPRGPVVNALRPLETQGINNGEPLNPVADASKFIGQFMAPFAAFSKLKYVQELGPVAKGFAAGAMADFVAFDEHEARLSNLLQKYEIGDGAPVVKAVRDYLAADPNDGWAEGRFKNVLEGGIAGTALEGGMRALGFSADALAKGVKYIRDGRRAIDESAAARAATTQKAAVLKPAVDEAKGWREWAATLAGQNKTDWRTWGGVKDVTPPEAMTSMDRFLDVIHRIEGTGKNPRSSAVGPFQFTQGTWLEEARLYDPALKKMPDAELAAMRTDPAKADFVREVGANFTKRNADYLAANGVERIDEPAMYLAHFLGKGDAAKVLKAADDVPVRDVVDAKSVTSNPEILAGKTVGEVKQWARDIYAKRLAQVGPAKAPEGAGTTVLGGFRPNREQIELATQRKMAMAVDIPEIDVRSGKVFEDLRRSGMMDKLNRVTTLQEEAFHTTMASARATSQRIIDGDMKAADDFLRNEGANYIELVGNVLDTFQDAGRAMGFRGHNAAAVKTNELLAALGEADNMTKQDIVKLMGEITKPEQMDEMVRQLNDQVQKHGTLKVLRESFYEFYVNSLLGSLKSIMVDSWSRPAMLGWNVYRKLPQSLVGRARVALGGNPMRVHATEAQALLHGYTEAIFDGARLMANAARKRDFGDVSAAIEAQKRRVSVNGLPYNRERWITPENYRIEKTKPWMSAESFGLQADTTLGRMADYVGRYLTAHAAITGAGRVTRFTGNFYAAGDTAQGAILQRGALKAEVTGRVLNEGLQPGSKAFGERFDALMAEATKDMPDDAKTAAGSKLLNLAAALRGGDDAPLVGESIRQKAINEAHRGTFTDDASKVAEGFKKLTLAAPGGRLILPFIHTVDRIVARGVESTTPFSLLTPRFYEKLKKGGRHADEALGDLATGTSMFVGAWWLAVNGMVSGEGPKDPGERNALLNTNRWRPRSVMLPGLPPVEIGRYMPWSMPFMIAANMVELEDQIDDPMDKRLEKHMMDYSRIGALAMANTMLGMTFMRGPAELMATIVDQDERGLNNFVQFMANSIATPRAIAFWANEMQPLMQEATSIEEAIRIGYGQKVRQKYDAFGRPRVRDPQMMGYIIPSSYVDLEKSETAQKLVAAGFMPEMPARNIEGVALNADEYAAYMNLVGTTKRNGRTLWESMDAYTKSDLYNRLPDTPRSGIEGAQGMTKGGMAKSIRDGYLQQAREVLKAGSPDLQRRILQYEQNMKTLPAATPSAERALDAQGFGATGGPVRVDFGLPRAP
jgi:hypothetical protein